MSRDYDYTKTYKTFQPAPKGGEASQVQDCHDPVQAEFLEVKVVNGNFDKAFRMFKSLVQRERILSSYKEKQSYEKPSDKKRRKRNEMKRKMMDFDRSKDKHETK